MAITGNTQLSAVKQTAISEIVQRELKFAAKLLPTVTDVSQFAVPGMNKIQFPKMTSFTVENRTSASAGTPQVLTSSVDELTLDYRAYISWVVDSVDAYQSNVNVKAAFIKSAGTAHARNIDDQIITKLDAAAGYVQAAGITQAKILNARKWLMKNQADVNSAVIVVNPDEEAALLAINEFIRADAYGKSNIPTGVIGSIYGMNVLVHTKPTLAKSWIYTKEAINFGFQMGANYAEQMDIDYGTTAMKCAVDQLYGLQAMRLTEGLDGAGVALAAGKSPFIAELSAD